MKQKIPKKYFIIPSISLIIYLLIRLIDEAKVIFHFPVNYTSEITSPMAQLFFLAKCGFHNICPYWYNGYKLFLLYVPGWFFFTYPLFLLIKNVQLTIYISMIIIFILAFILTYLFGKTQKFSFSKILFFFTIFFANPINIGNFIGLGRLNSLLSWVLFIAIATIILYYKDKELKKYFWILPILFACIILTHLSEALLAFFMLFSLFIIRSNKKDRIKIIFVGLISLLLSYFWLKPFLFNTTKQTTLGWIATERLLDFSGQWMWTNLATFIVIPVFLILFLFYWKSKKELLFYLPTLLLAILVLSRLIIFIPILNQIYPDDYMLFFTFFSLIFLFKTRYNIKLHKYIKYGLIILSIILIIVSFSKTPFFPDKTQLEEDVKLLIPHVNGRFVMFHTNGNQAKEVSHSSIYSYAAIFYNKNSTLGFSWNDIPFDYIVGVRNISDYIESYECDKIKEQSKKFNTTNILTFTEYCKTLKNCEFTEIKSKGETCLYEIR